MTVRPASLLVAALALLPAPALAQDSTAEEPPAADEAAPADTPDDPPPPPEEASAEPAPAPGEEAAPSPSDAPALAPAPEAVPAPAPAAAAIPAVAPPPSPFTPDQRNGWLAQCRNVFLQRGATLGGGNGQPDACDKQLLDFERSYVPPAGGQSGPPTIMVRVPVARQAPAPSPEELGEPGEPSEAGEAEEPVGE